MNIGYFLVLSCCLLNFSGTELIRTITLLFGFFWYDLGNFGWLTYAALGGCIVQLLVAFQDTWFDFLSQVIPALPFFVIYLALAECLRAETSFSCPLY